MQKKKEMYESLMQRSVPHLNEMFFHWLKAKKRKDRKLLERFEETEERSQRVCWSERCLAPSQNGNGAHV